MSFPSPFGIFLFFLITVFNVSYLIIRSYQLKSFLPVFVIPLFISTGFSSSYLLQVSLPTLLILPTACFYLKKFYYLFFPYRLKLLLQTESIIQTEIILTSSMILTYLTFTLINLTNFFKITNFMDFTGFICLYPLKIALTFFYFTFIEFTTFNNFYLLSFLPNFTNLKTYYILTKFYQFSN